MHGEDGRKRRRLRRSWALFSLAFLVSSASFLSQIDAGNDVVDVIIGDVIVVVVIGGGVNVVIVVVAISAVLRTWFLLGNFYSILLYSSFCA